MRTSHVLCVNVLVNEKIVDWTCNKSGLSENTKGTILVIKIKFNEGSDGEVIQRGNLTVFRKKLKVKTSTYSLLDDPPHPDLRRIEIKETVEIIRIQLGEFIIWETPHKINCSSYKEYLKKL